MGHSDVFWGEIAPCDHLLQFYDSDNVLLDTLQGFIYGGLQAGESAIVIATPSHLDQLEARLEAMGVNLPAALADDQYIPLNAEETLARFMVNDWPDEERFAKAVNEILSRARGNGRKVRAFGEMVAILWANGLSGATVRLEHLWNKLCHSDGFSLFCAYPKIGITKKDAAQAISDICAAHSRIIGHS
jgi:DcmR-like sensory protein